MRIPLLLAALCTALAAPAQNLLYRSYGDFAEHRGQTVGGPIDVEPHWGRFVVVYVQDGRRQRIPARKLWGFMNQGAFYRIEREAGLPVRLMAQGAIAYWENGLAHLRMQRDSTEAATIEFGHAAYLSRDMQGNIVPASFPADDAKSASAKFKAAWPVYHDLLERIGNGGDMDRVRQLVVEYEVAVEEGRAPGP